MARESVKLVRAALDETPGGDIILRGSLDCASFSAIKIAAYQRETLSLKQLSSLIGGFRDGGKIPDIVIGMRGGNYLERDGAFYLQDETYVIDGLQRISAAMHCMRSGVHASPSLGAIVYFNTTEDSEKDLFTILNTQKAKLSPNVLVRNLRETNQGVALLFEMCDDREFALYDRVCWQQNKRRQEILTSLTVIKVINVLHSSFASGVLWTNWQPACNAFEKIMLETTGRKIFQVNVTEFFNSIDKIWGIRNVAFVGGASYLKTGFLLALANVYSKHKNFWDKDRRLKIPSDFLAKLKTFPIGDPHVKALAVGSSGATMVLQGLLVDHFNSGKRVNRLTPFKESDVSGSKVAKKTAKSIEAA